MVFLRRILTLVVIAASLMAAWLFLKSPLMQLQAIEIVLDPSSKDAFMFDRIRSGLKGQLASYLGMPFWKVSLDSVLSDVKKDQRVSTVQIEREFPHKMRVLVTPKKPLLGYMDE